MPKKNFKKQVSFKQKGFGLIEILVFVAVGAGVFLSLEQYLTLSLKSIDQDTGQTEALYRAKGLLEEARAVRDEEQGSDREYGWNQLAGLTLGNPYHFTSGGSPLKWSWASGNQVIDGYTIWFTTSAVERDGGYNIVSSGSPDSDTLKITAYVSWVMNGVTKQISLFEYLTNYK